VLNPFFLYWTNTIEIVSSLGGSILGSKSKKSGQRIRMLEISWVASGVIVLVILQFGLKTIYKVGWFDFLVGRGNH
jgi:hypothetical protein